ncbi:DUF4124 domain-containing protein [Pelobacter seleniigenes]|uniref:DUF4124 domain-containing protein n=1 Tax=Pelobacter seleniigenes TaxID=407188 RepID=UPI0004A72753|nr:DUF4124 domain-containing protein [Pelobacter seleniigenes]
MNIFIKILLCSFPIVLAGLIFWPTIKDNIPLTYRSATFDESRLATAIVPAAQREVKAQTAKPTVQRSVPAKAAPQKQSGIYRWVDENGHVVYSDRPDSADAVAHTPKPIGYLSASGTPHNTQTVASFSAPVQTTTVVQIAQADRQDFTFSTLSASQKYGYVLLTGRISDGFACKRLQVTVVARKDTGRRVRGYDVVSYNGFGSALYEVKIPSSWNGKGRRPQWETAEVRAQCKSL